ncbi:hypothetical protein TSAR_004538 [Trichomalopsis sarcophagae]|uniref:Uncharacterized protein n=1 Tax=Trichomalopsis sarcophagae TaxID=543379 RepID=A0A232EME7_9HYME|nr:hypothetical protein TSAR_004538 [Trichomalopsis sarcophagae]
MTRMNDYWNVCNAAEVVDYYVNHHAGPKPGKMQRGVVNVLNLINRWINTNKVLILKTQQMSNKNTVTLNRIGEQQIDRTTKESDVQSSEVERIVVLSTTIQTNTAEGLSASVKDSSEIKKGKVIPLIDLTILDADEIKKSQ